MMGVDDIDKTTPLFAEMSICANVLHCSHSEFEKLSRIDKKKLKLYVDVHSRKLEKEDEERQKKFDMQRNIEHPKLQEQDRRKRR